MILWNTKILEANYQTLTQSIPSVLPVCHCLNHMHLTKSQSLQILPEPLRKSKSLYFSDNICTYRLHANKNFNCALRNAVTGARETQRIDCLVGG